MKSLTLLNDSTNIKLGDTDTLIQFKANINDVPVFLKEGQIATFRIKNDTGFLKSINATTTMNGYIFQFDSSELVDLPVDSYQVELAITESEKDVSIFPDKGFVNFNITENALSVIGDQLPVMSLDAFKNELNTYVKTKADELESNFADYVDSVKQGPQGIQGPQGDNGQAATVSIGKVTTLDPDQKATVTNSGDSLNAMLNFGIPKGDKGDAGADGVDGKNATIQIGTVTTSSDNTGSVTNSGTDTSAMLDFTLPIDTTALDTANRASQVAYSVLDQSNKNAVNLMAIQNMLATMQNTLTVLQNAVNPVNIPNNDLNQVKDTKIYLIQGNTVTNAPVPSVWGIMLVYAFPNLSNGLQILADTNSNRLYFRTWNSYNSFKQWKSSYYYG